MNAVPLRRPLAPDVLALLRTSWLRREFRALASACVELEARASTGSPGMRAYRAKKLREVQTRLADLRAELAGLR